MPKFCGLLTAIEVLHQSERVPSDDFKTITRCSLFPHKFCPVRWLENSVVLSRAVEMVEPLSVYVKEIEKSPPKSKYFESVRDGLKDRLLKAKLHFLISIAIEMEPFLRKYQTAFPMLPFLQNDLYSLMRGLMTRVVVSSRMSKVSSVANLLKVDLSLFDNLRPIGTVDIGSAAEKELVTQKSVKKLDIDKFKEQCQKFIVSICQKLVDKTSMDQKLFRGATCLSPFIMTRELASLRAKTAVNYLIDQNRMNILDGEMVLKEYSALVSCDSVKKELRNFRVKQRLDPFLFDILERKKCSDELKKFFQMILILFYGNAAVERSFSFNREFLTENLKIESLIAQRCVHDAVRIAGSAKNVVITKNMMKASSAAHRNRKNHLEHQLSEDEENELKRKRAADEIIDLRAKK
ncbi:hypothetical protein QAD02_002400 [Eretmocerus hayati]|uniref:Uncharacterized protein n=1 Tax=Eretmocerus hayati TaxID=131215 RepID=A0ACC2NKJ1_9HYME|nr:hypothetical protein QAD02_002400 [Eretmocerus hayati]